MSTKALKRQLVAAIAMVLVAAVALSGSTFAWFASNKVVTAQTITATAQSTELLRIAGDNTGYSTALSLNLNVAQFEPVSAGVTLAKAGTFYKVEGWTERTDGAAADAGQVANQFVPATLGTDYAMADLWLTDNQAKTVYFNSKTIVRAKTTVALKSDSSTLIDVYAQFKAGSGITTYTLAKDTALTFDANTGLISNGVATWDADENIVAAKEKLQNALGALRLTFVPYATATAEDSTTNTNDTTAHATMAPAFYSLYESTAGYFNTEDGTAGFNVESNKRIASVSNKTATLETDSYTILSNSVQLCNLTYPNAAQHFKVYCYLEGCDKQCITGIADDVTYVVDLAFSTTANQ